MAKKHGYNAREYCWRLDRAKFLELITYRSLNLAILL